MRTSGGSRTRGRGIKWPKYCGRPLWMAPKGPSIKDVRIEGPWEIFDQVLTSRVMKVCKSCDNLIKNCNFTKNLSYGSVHYGRRKILAISTHSSLLSPNPAADVAFLSKIVKENNFKFDLIILSTIVDLIQDKPSFSVRSLQLLAQITIFQ